MRRLTTYVHAVERDDKGNPGRSQVFGPDDEVPDWARAVISNPDVWDQAETAEKSISLSTGELERLQLEFARAGGTKWLPMPNKAGAGSSLEAWRAYADQEGVTVSPGAGRDEIIAAVEAARQ